MERGDYVRREKDNWSPRAVNVEGKYQTKEVWRDKNGKAIENLKADDFTVLEDGKPQKIAVFEYQRLETESPVPSQASLKQRAGEPKPGSKRDITPSPAGEVRYKDRRLIVLFFDLSSMPQADQIIHGQINRRRIIQRDVRHRNLRPDIVPKSIA